MKPVEVSAEAISNLQKIGGFLRQKWSPETAFKFTVALESAFESIARNP